MKKRDESSLRKKRIERSKRKTMKREDFLLLRLLKRSADREKMRIASAKKKRNAVVKRLLKGMREKDKKESVKKMKSELEESRKKIREELNLRMKSVRDVKKSSRRKWNASKDLSVKKKSVDVALKRKIKLTGTSFFMKRMKERENS